MRYLLFIVFLAFFYMPDSAFGQRKNRASLEIILSDHSALQVSINGKLFNKINNRLVIHDLPARNNYIEVIQKCNRSADKNCRDKMVFSGRIRFEKNKNYQAVVLVDEGKLMLTDDASLIPKVAPPPTSINSEENFDATEFTELSNIKKNLQPEIKALGERMNTMLQDKDRVEEAMRFLNQKKSITTDESIGISSWILYDENRLDFLKKAFPFVSNKENFDKAVMSFTMMEIRERFLQFCEENID